MGVKYVPMTDDEITEQLFMGVGSRQLVPIVEQAVLARIESQGLVIVPRESTSRMDIAAMERHEISKELACDIWETMLEATKEST
jgi:hypothetical protein